jgi:preprotein translocase subunit SecE
MARQTRSERRARRAAQAESQAAAVDRGRSRPTPSAPLRPAVEPAHAPETSRKLPGSGLRTFIGESWAELKKVEWPGQPQLVQGTVVVLIACLVVGVYLFAADEVFKRLVQHVLLR